MGTRTRVTSAVICAVMLGLLAQPMAVSPAAAAARRDHPHGRTVVSLQWDDGSAHQIAVRHLLLRFGFHATFYVNSGHIGTRGFMSWRDLHKLAGDGNEIAGHTLTHVDLTAVKPARARHQICDDRVQLFDHGFRPTNFAYPFGSLNRRLEHLVRRCGYNSGRGVYGLLSSGCDTGDPCPAAEKIPPPDPYFTRTTEAPIRSTKLGTLKRYVRVAERHHGGWVQIFFHKVCAACDKYSTRLRVLAPFFRWLAERRDQGTVVKTVRQIIGGPIRPPVHS